MCQFEQVQLEDCQGTGYTIASWLVWRIVSANAWARLGLCRSDSRHRTIPAPSCARVSTSDAFDKYRSYRNSIHFPRFFFKWFFQPKINLNKRILLKLWYVNEQMKWHEADREVAGRVSSGRGWMCLMRSIQEIPVHCSPYIHCQVIRFA